MVCNSLQTLFSVFTTLYSHKLFSALKLLTNSEMLTENSRLCKWSMFSSVDPSLAERKCAKIYLSPAAYGMILQDHRQLPVCIFRNKIASLGSFKSVDGRAFKINKSFKKKTSQTFALFKQLSQKNVKTISACTKSTFRDLIPLKKKAH
jgi:hypothetical protein